MNAEYLNEFVGRHVVVTGAGRAGQTGEVIARAFAARGATVVIVDRDIGTATARTDELIRDGHAAHPIACDLASESEVARMAQELRKVCGQRGLAALVNGAGGFAMSGNVAESELSVWEKQFDINLRTCYITTRALLPLLRLGKGAVVNFATAAAAAGKGGSGMSAYLAAKSGVLSLTRTLALEEARQGVRVNAVAPTAIRTAANLESMGEGKKYVEREEVAAVVLFLSSRAAAAVSGEVIRLA